MNTHQFCYTINGSTYIQKPLVLGQIGQLTALLQNISFTSTDPLSIIAALGNSLPRLVAVVVRKEGEMLADKDLTAMQRDIGETDLKTAVQIVTDFFVCNPIQSLAQSLDGIAAAINQTVTGSENLSVSSLSEI